MNMRRLAVVAIVGAWSIAAQAMPPQVSDNWLPNMWQRLGVMATNPGFCVHSTNGSAWICDPSMNW